MANPKRLFGGIGVAALAGGLVAFASSGAFEAETETDTADGAWHIKAENARIIGGYGDNFAYDGKNVRPVKGWAEARINAQDGTGEVTIELETTAKSGPIQFAKDKSWTGKIRIVQKIDTQKMDKARIAQDVYLHGNTGREAPVMPKLYNYFATWGPSKIMVNGEEVIPMIGSHTMFSEQARGKDGKIDRGGEIYSPKRANKAGFADASETEFHYVAHTMEPDPNNFPPHTGWIHLHFGDVQVLEKPTGMKIPHVAAE